jgi:hypothetical protein
VAGDGKDVVDSTIYLRVNSGLLPDLTVLDLPGDFTIEFWQYFVSGAAVGIISRPNGSGINPVALDLVTGVYRLRASSNGTSHDLAVTFGGQAPTANTWEHIALTRSGNTWRLFRAGTQIGTTTSSITPFISTNPLIIGARVTTANFFNGNIDDLRITKKNIARYTANFTPPTAAHPTS